MFTNNFAVAKDEPAKEREGVDAWASAAGNNAVFAGSSKPNVKIYYGQFPKHRMKITATNTGTSLSPPGSAKRFCRKCLTKDMPDAAYFENMHEYIRNLDEDIKAPDILYKERLSLCRQCENLLNGMCRICGCFVEMRAAVEKNYCPAVHKKW